MTGQPKAERRALRADARRNLQRLLSEAQRAFAERGMEAPLEDIARRAGVGIGTLYRHFPTRQALIEAAFADGIDTLHLGGRRFKSCQPDILKGPVGAGQRAFAVRLPTTDRPQCGPLGTR